MIYPAYGKARFINQVRRRYRNLQKLFDQVDREKRLEPALKTIQKQSNIYQVDPNDIDTKEQFSKRYLGDKKFHNQNYELLHSQVFDWVYDPLFLQTKQHLQQPLDGMKQLDYLLENIPDPLCLSQRKLRVQNKGQKRIMANKPRITPRYNQQYFESYNEQLSKKKEAKSATTEAQDVEQTEDT